MSYCLLNEVYFDSEAEWLQKTNNQLLFMEKRWLSKTNTINMIVKR